MPADSMIHDMVSSGLYTPTQALALWSRAKSEASTEFSGDTSNPSYWAKTISLLMGYVGPRVCAKLGWDEIKNITTQYANSAPSATGFTIMGSAGTTASDGLEAEVKEDWWVGLFPNKKARLRLSSLVSALPSRLAVPEGQYHVTVKYLGDSVKKDMVMSAFDTFYDDYADKKVVSAKPLRYDLFGPDNTDLVLVLESQQAAALKSSFDQLLRSWGSSRKDDFDTYNPHITLARGLTKIPSSLPEVSKLGLLRFNTCSLLNGDTHVHGDYPYAYVKSCGVNK